MKQIIWSENKRLILTRLIYTTHCTINKLPHEYKTFIEFSIQTENGSKLWL
jgi:hypothetical protein